MLDKLMVERASKYLPDMRFYGRHPWTRRYRSWIETTKATQITQPWQVLGKKYETIVTLLGGAYAISDDIVHAEDIPPPPEPLDVMVARVMMRPSAQTYLWDFDTLQLALKSDLPPHVIGSDNMPHLFMLFMFSAPLVSVDEYGKPANNWLLIANVPGSIRLYFDMEFDYETEGRSHILYMNTIPYGKRYPEDFDDIRLEMVGSVLKMLAFINSPYTSNDKVGVARRERREVANHMHQEVRNTAGDTINVVKLRREVQEQIDKIAAEGAGGRRKYHDVSGHYKMQPYGPRTDNARKMIWIAPYGRGDKLLGMVDKVYHVVR